MAKSPDEDSLKLMDQIFDRATNQFFYKQDKIAELFHRKFIRLTEKVTKVLTSNMDELDFDVYVDSILLDCRALFFDESEEHEVCTLQSLFKSRGHHELAAEIDKYFDRKIVNDRSVRDIIKRWVNKRVAHYQIMHGWSEHDAFDDKCELVDMGNFRNIFRDILLIKSVYDLFLEKCGKSASDQAFRTINNFLSGTRK